MLKPSRAGLKIVLLCLLAITVTLVLTRFRLAEVLTFENLKRHQLELTEVARTHRLQAMVTYLGVYIGVTALSLPGATLLTLAGGAIFGILWGTVAVSIASTLGATAAFLVARFLVGSAVQNRFGDRLEKIHEGILKEGAFYLFSLRLVPVFPFFIVNLLMALTPIRTWTYLWVSQLGMLPATLAYVNAGTQLSELSSPSEILSPGVWFSFAILGVLPLLAKKTVDAVRRGRKRKSFKKPSHYDYNLLVIGAGAGGLVSSYIGATVRAKVALIEKDQMGGDCLNRGCVPSKSLIHSAKIISYSRRAREFGFRSSSVEFEFSEVMERVRQIIRSIAPNDSVERYQGMGVDCIQGKAKVLSPYEVEVQTGSGIRRLTTRNLILATGSVPQLPAIAGLEQVPYLTSDTIWDLKVLPRRLLILGGGPIGCELAQAFQRFGSQVTIIERGAQLLAREDEDVTNLIRAQFEKEGIEVLTDHHALRATTSENGSYEMICEFHSDDRKIEKTVPFDTLLLALGREARVEGSGLEALELERNEKGMIVCNEKMQTQYPNVYACGDAAGPYLFTHVAAHQAWYASVNALFRPFKSFKADYRVIPATTFVDPEVARVGLNEREARARRIHFEVTRFPLAELDRAVTESETRGFVKVLTPPGSDRILGVTIVAAHAGEMLPEYVTAMKFKLGLNQILGTIHTYPTFSEANKYAAGSWKKAHAPEKLLQLLQKYHRFRRGRAAISNPVPPS